MRLRAALAFAMQLSALVLGAGSASAQQVVFAANATSALDSSTQAALTRELGQAKARGIPVEPLLAKVREGVLKRAKPDRIRTAVSLLAVRLDSARSALGIASNSAELVAGADALGAGADVAALRAVRSASGARDVAAPLGALAQLVATGVPTKRATQMIVDLMRRDVSPERVLALGVAVESDVSAGVPARESAVFRMREIEASLAFGDKVTSATQALGGQYQHQDGGKGGQPRRRP